jgi:hypothetical protein
LFGTARGFIPPAAGGAESACDEVSSESSRSVAQPKRDDVIQTAATHFTPFDMMLQSSEIRRLCAGMLRCNASFRASLSSVAMASAKSSL